MSIPKQQTMPLKLSDLPKVLQKKYKNSPVFQSSTKQQQKKFKFDPQKIKKRKIDKQKTIQQKLDEFTINPTQLKHLQKVFALIARGKNSFGHDDIAHVLTCMGMQMSKGEIEQMIWEFDEDLDRRITVNQFQKMYKRCMMDKSAAEPKKLFHLTQFLMYCRPGYYNITVQDTLQLLYVRALQQAQKNKQCIGKVIPTNNTSTTIHTPALQTNPNNTIVKDLFEEAIKVIFGEQYEGENGVEREICFEDYLQKINKKAIEKRKKEIQKIKAQLRYS